MRRKAISRAQKSRKEQNNTDKAENVPSIENKEDGVENDIETQVASKITAVAEVAKHGKKRDGTKNIEEVSETNDEKVLDGNVIPVSKHGRKKAAESIVDENLNGSADIVKEIIEESEGGEEVKAAEVETNSNDNHEQNVSEDEKTFSVVGKRDKKKTVAKDTDSEKVLASKRGRKPAVKHSDDQNAIVSEGQATDYKTQEHDITKENSEANGNTSNNGLFLESKNDSEVPRKQGNVIPAPKRGRKKATETIVDENLKESTHIGKGIMKEGEEEVKVDAKAVTDANHEQNVSNDEKTSVISKHGKKKAAVQDTDNDKVHASRRGRKPVVKNSDDQNANVSEGQATNYTTEPDITNKNSEANENPSSDGLFSESKNDSKLPRKRGRKKVEVAVEEIRSQDTLNSVKKDIQDEKSSNLSDEDFQSSSYHTASKKRVVKHAKKNPVGNKASEDVSLESIVEKTEEHLTVQVKKSDNSVPDKNSSSKNEIIDEQPAKRGRKRKNKNEDVETNQTAKPYKISDDNFARIKEVKIILNREDALVDNVKNSSNAEVIDDSEGKIKTVVGQKGRAAKRGKDKEGKDDAETAEEKPAKVPKKTEKSKKEKIPDVTALDFTSESKTSSGKPWNFKISSWNINGIRAWLEKDGISYLHHEKPDILCIQETKCSDDKLPSDVKNVGDYHTYWLSGDKDGYSGVGLLSKEKPLKVDYGIGIKEHDNEGRVITAEYENFFLVATYVPNAGRGLVRLDYRMKWDKDFRGYLRKLDERKPVVLCGDLNVAHEEIDLANPKANKRNAGFTKEERDGFSTLLENNGFFDTFRHLYPETKGAYTFWTYMMNARSKNVGWRLDYFVMSKRFEENLCDSVIRKDVFGSDHCPITLFLAL